MEDKIRGNNKVNCIYCGSNMTSIKWMGGKKYRVCGECEKSENVPLTYEDVRDWR